MRRQMTVLAMSLSWLEGTLLIIRARISRRIVHCGTGVGHRIRTDRAMWEKGSCYTSWTVDSIPIWRSVRPTFSPWLGKLIIPNSTCTQQVIACCSLNFLACQPRFVTFCLSEFGNFTSYFVLELLLEFGSVAQGKDALWKGLSVTNGARAEQKTMAREKMQVDRVRSGGRHRSESERSEQIEERQTSAPHEPDLENFECEWSSYQDSILGDVRINLGRRENQSWATLGSILGDVRINLRRRSSYDSPKKTKKGAATTDWKRLENNAGALPSKIPCPANWETQPKAWAAALICIAERFPTPLFCTM